jgi:hypothetical protein
MALGARWRIEGNPSISVMKKIWVVKVNMAIAAGTLDQGRAIVDALRKFTDILDQCGNPWQGECGLHEVDDPRETAEERPTLRAIPGGKSNPSQAN